MSARPRFRLEPPMAPRRRTGITAFGAAAAFILAAGTAHADGDAGRGEKLFEECRACHAAERGVEGLGPELHGMFGRRAGGLDNFRYSPALRRSGIVWTPQTLDAYVADPQKLVPANRMPYSGMPDARDRADLIAFMQQVFK
jgi:cytochrome c